MGRHAVGQRDEGVERGSDRPELGGAADEPGVDDRVRPNVLHLQDELAGTENRIAVERMRYNEAVKVYNQTIKSFPANLLAGMFGFKDGAFFDAHQEAKTAPKVQF